MIIAAKTDVGKVRSANEDSFFVSDIINDSVVAVVADGMGGHKGGKTASSMTVEYIENIVYENDLFSVDYDMVPTLLSDAVSVINSFILTKADEDDNLKGMGTTFVSCIVRDRKAICANIGDSRLYYMNESGMMQISKDHSMVQELVDMGSISEEDAKHHPNLNIITRALGTDETVNADFFEFEVNPGDYILLCSDGLVNMVSDEDIYAVVTESATPGEACEKLIDMANEAGGRDNITIVIIGL